jgi:pyruvate dehydrogenase E1 component alpha subunit
VHCGYDSRTWRTAPQCTPIATHLLHATGVAYGHRRLGQDTVALAYLGDGATSEGDFHEALNFAAIFAAPVVFLVQNNGIAISVPLERQTAAPSLAAKGIGYGVRAEQVDGNDAVAMLAVLNEAVRRARDGGGPFLVEAHTYRMGGHTNLDDPACYRDPAETDAWARRDPIARLGTYLRGLGILSEAENISIHAAAAERASTLEGQIRAMPAPGPSSVTGFVYASPPQHTHRRASTWGDI